MIPETAVLRGTVRTTSENVRERAHELIRQIPAGIAGAHGATSEVEIRAGYPVTMNDDGVAALVERDRDGAARRGPRREMPWPTMGSEDFSYVLQRVPGAMVFLGATPDGPRPDDGPADHSNKVILDEIGDGGRRRAPRGDGRAPPCAGRVDPAAGATGSAAAGRSPS